MRYALAFISIFFMVACTTTKPTITEFKINIDVDKIESNSLGCKEKTLKISKAFAEPSLMSLKMDYVQGKNKVFTYSKSQWVATPAQSIYKQIFFSLRDSKLFKNVNLNASRSISEYSVEIIIEDFMQYYDEEFNKSFANVKININIINLKDSSVVASKNFSSRVDVKTLNAEGGVEALNLALADVVEQNLNWFVGVCK